MHISYVTIGDSRNIHNWSGLEYYIGNALQEHAGEVNYIGNLEIRKKWSLRPTKIMYRLLGKRFDGVRDPHFALQCSRYVESCLHHDTDVVFSPGTVATALLETEKPKVIYSDNTFAGLLDYYVRDYCSVTIKNGHYLEQKALDSASLALYSSEYAARSAIEDYNIDPGKVKVVPFGGNFSGEVDPGEIRARIRLRSRKTCHLLFLGVNWQRKGGDLAVRVARKLNDEGIHTILHVIGIKDLKLNPMPDFIRNHGFISKSGEGEKKIMEIMKDCHFLILPTRAEAYGLVFCEANAMGLPAIATSVGGVPTIIKDDVNGKLFDLQENEAAYASYIASVFYDKERYEELAFSSFNEYATRLNWRVAGETISNLIKDL